ncbi:MAG: peptidase [Candidatus Peribacteria bacterium]|nr:peptidase [Candidatus Peribacteria bacterium]
MFGAIAGATALIAAAPFVVQLSSAASGTSAVSAITEQTDTDKEVPDAQEAAIDTSKATVTADAAAKTALASQPGQVKENTLDNENGTLAYKVEITNASKDYDVLVDATSGKVLKSTEDTKDAPDHADANEVNDATEVKDAPGKDDANETNEAPGQADQNEQDEGTQASVTSSAK